MQAVRSGSAPCDDQGIPESPGGASCHGYAREPERPSADAWKPVPAPGPVARDPLSGPHWRGDAALSPRILTASHPGCSGWGSLSPWVGVPLGLSLIHISEPTRLGMISYAVFCLKK